MPTIAKLRATGSIATPAVAIRTTFRNSSGVNGGGVYAPNYPINRTLGTFSDLKYQTGNDGSFRPCTHSSKRFYVRPVEGLVATWIDTRPPVQSGVSTPILMTGLEATAHQRYYTNFIAAVNSTSVDVNSIQWSALAHTALDNLMPSFGGSNSIVNSILELKDFRRLGQSISTRFISKWDVVRAALGYEWFDKPMKRLSKMSLSAQFGWIPLYGDILRLVDTLKHFEQRYRYWKSMANTDLQKHFRTVVSGTSASDATVFDSKEQTPPGNIGNTSFRYRAFVYRAGTDGIRYSATLRYRYPLPPEMATTAGKVKAFLDVLGVSGNPAIIWNAIPFSFLVDWVVNVSSWLNKLRIDNIRFQTEIRDFCHSAVVSRTVAYNVQFAQGYTGAFGAQTRVWSNLILTDGCTVKSFVRKKGIPSFGTAIQTSGLNAREFLLGGALLHANRR